MKRLFTLLLVTIVFGGCLFAQNSQFVSANGKEAAPLQDKGFINITSPQIQSQTGDKNLNSLPRKGNDVKQGKKYQKLGYPSIVKSKNDDVATVTLVVGEDPYGDGRGFQMLLDADHLLYQNIDDPNFVGFIQDFYDEFEYTIPINADANVSNPNVVLNGSESITIPEGIYDIFITHPAPEYGRIFIALWADNYEYAMADDFVFKAGYEYIYTIEEWNEVIFEPEYDVALVSLNLPAQSTELTDSEDITVGVANFGEHVIPSVELSYRINGGSVFTETYSAEIAVGGEVSYTFTTKGDFSTGGFYTVEAWVTYEDDMKPMNNKLTGYTKKPVPIVLPFVENFDDFSTLDTNWTIIDSDNGWQGWQYDDWNIDADGGIGAMQINAPRSWGGESAPPADEYLITEPMLISTAGDYHISFYTMTSWGTESLRILYGTSSNPEDMDVLVNYPELHVSNWSVYFHNFEIETSGNYYFAFHNYSSEATGGVSMIIDKVTIKEGEFVGIKGNTIPASQINLYPNPAKETLNIELSGQEIEKINVYNSAGATVFSSTTKSVGSSYKLNTAPFSSGVYFISVQTKTGIVSSKFIVK